MHGLASYRRIVLLTEGQLGLFTSKTAACLLRYRPSDIVAVLDSQVAGRDMRDFVAWSPPVPIVASMADALPLRPDSLFVGIAPVGGDLPESMRRPIREALEAGVSVVSGLHARLGADESFRASALRSGAKLADLRVPPPPTIATARARQLRCRRILTVGSDCNVGKMVAAVELTRRLRERGHDARFAATGQTGMMIADSGVAIDAVVADFAAGAAEELVCAAADADYCVVEGQGSLSHPAYSGVTLALLHGTCPDALVLVHHAGRTNFRAEPCWPLPSNIALCHAYESCAALLHPARIVGVALNAAGADEETVRNERRLLERQLGVPVADLLHEPGDELIDAILAACPPPESRA
jgi:uncharacterized NAD-dependent epimerase/dehydratase family protein